MITNKFFLLINCTHELNPNLKWFGSPKIWGNRHLVTPETLRSAAAQGKAVKQSWTSSSGGTLWLAALPSVHQQINEVLPIKNNINKKQNQCRVPLEIDASKTGQTDIFLVPWVWNFYFHPTKWGAAPSWLIGFPILWHIKIPRKSGSMSP
jgi:hypothetical protein